MRRFKPETLILPAVAAVVILADQLTKSLVATRLAEGQSWDIHPWLTPFLRITHVTNTGVAFGLFPGLGDIFIGVAIIVVTVIVIYYWHLPAGQWAVRLALGLQLGGAISNNLIDRLRQGYVVDFLDFNFWPMHEWPIFNLADTAIVTGVSLLALLILREEQIKRDKQQVAGNDAA